MINAGIGMSKYATTFNRPSPSGMSIITRMSPKGYATQAESAIILSNLRKKREDIMGRDDLCICGSGKKAEDCHREIVNGSVIYLLWEKYLALSKEIERQISENNVKPLCNARSFCNVKSFRGHCNKCCNDYFYVSAIEYFLIKNDIIETKGLSKFDEYVYNANQQLKHKTSTGNPSKYKHK